MRTLAKILISFLLSLLFLSTSLSLFSKVRPVRSQGRDKSHGRYLQWISVIAPLQIAFTVLKWTFNKFLPKKPGRAFGPDFVFSLAFIVLIHGCLALWPLGAAVFLHTVFARLKRTNWSTHVVLGIVWGLGLIGIVANEFFFTDRFEFETSSFLPVWRGLAPPTFQVGYTFRYTIMRALSYCMDMGNAPSHKTTSLLQFLHYVTSFPLYLCGPLIPYSQYSSQVATQSKSLGIHTKDVIKDVICVMLIEGVSRTFYYPQYTFTSLLRELSAFETWFVCQCFLVMAFLESHLPFALSRLCAMLDGLQPVEDTPLFLWETARSFEHFFRCFHASWYRWLVRYVYKPTGGGWLGSACALITSLILHGAGSKWCLLAELAGVGLVIEKWLSKQWWQFRKPPQIITTVNRTLTLSSILFAIPSVSMMNVVQFIVTNIFIENLVIFVLA